MSLLCDIYIYKIYTIYLLRLFKFLFYGILYFSYGVSNIQYEQDAPIGYPSYNFDRGVNETTDPNFYPEGIRKIVNYINNR